MLNNNEYALVIDGDGNKLSPTKVQKAWFLIRKNRAKLIQRYPMVIQLNKYVEKENIDNTEINCGIDDGSKHVGISLIQKCKTKNKVFFKGVIELRQDVKKKMDIRREYRRYKRNCKHYRPQRFDNRNSVIKAGLPTPSIRQKKDSIIRVVKELNKFVKIDTIHLEDVKIDIRELVENKKLYGNEYNKSNKLNKSLRLATLMRDNFQCQECGKQSGKLEVHHIIPRCQNGSDIIYNVITLCEKCHQKTEGKEYLFKDKYQAIIGNINEVRLDYPQHVMQGKRYLQNELKKLGALQLTNGIETSAKREEWLIDKSHSNDAICITGLKPSNDVVEYTIIPQRRKSKAKSNGLNGFKHRDYVVYHHTDGKYYNGVITAIYTDGTNTLNVKTQEKHFKRVSCKRCNLLYRFNKIQFSIF